MEFMKLLINLDSRKDRLEESYNEFQKIGYYDVLRLPAVQANVGVFGCAFSHMLCLGQAKVHQKSAMVFEDDFKLIGDYTNILPAALKELEDLDFAIFYWGGNINGPIHQVTEHLGRVTQCQSTHAMLINFKYIDQILVTIPCFYGMPLDLIYSNYIIPNFPCYISAPEMIATQRGSFSDIEHTYNDYEGIMRERYSSNFIPLKH